MPHSHTYYYRHNSGLHKQKRFVSIVHLAAKGGFLREKSPLVFFSRQKTYIICCNMAQCDTGLFCIYYNIVPYKSQRFRPQIKEKFFCGKGFSFGRGVRVSEIEGPEKPETTKSERYFPRSLFTSGKRPGALAPKRGGAFENMVFGFPVPRSRES